MDCMEHGNSITVMTHVSHECVCVCCSSDLGLCYVFLYTCLCCGCREVYMCTDEFGTVQLCILYARVCVVCVIGTVCMDVRMCV